MSCEVLLKVEVDSAHPQKPRILFIEKPKNNNNNKQPTFDRWLLSSQVTNSICNTNSSLDQMAAVRQPRPI